eukprot:TCALIF_03491-PA protein Name:"Protein of unknown function" AED:0.36 eAED:0.36 QI:0/-1/0/1/-1/1/1/0/272
MTLAAETMSVFPSSVVKSSKSLGFSIDSIVGAKTGTFNSESRLKDSLTLTPTDLRIKDRSPPSGETRVHRPFSPAEDDHPHHHHHNRHHHHEHDRQSRSRSRSPLIDPDRQSPSPQSSSSLNRLSNSGSPPTSPSLVRPIPSMHPGSNLRDLAAGFPGLPLSQSYLEQLAHLKAIYDRSGEGKSPPCSMPGGMSTPVSIPSSMSHGHPLHPNLPNHLSPAAAASLMGLPRPHSIPPMFLGGGGGPPQMGQPIPREYPLYPWFLTRNRFPGGK